MPVSPTVTLQSVTDILWQALDQFVGNVVTALPKLLAGIVFLVVGAVVVKFVTTAVRFVLKRTPAGESAVYREFVATVVAVFLWFGIALSFLSVVGLDKIAASIGSAAGFVALGVSYALSNVIADMVAGVYLLRDPDFMVGDRVDIGGTVGVVKSIELRKTRLEVDDNTVVRGNAEIEKEWTKLNDEDEFENKKVEKRA